MPDREQAESARRADLPRFQRVDSLSPETSAGLLRMVLDAVTDAIVVVDDDRTVVLDNAVARRIFGRERGLLGLSLDDLLPPEDGGGREPGTGHELVGRRADGRVFLADIRVTGVIADGRPLDVVMLRDVTEDRASAATLFGHQAKLDAALASIEDGLAVFSASGRLVEFNDAFLAFHRFRECEQHVSALAEFPEFVELRNPEGEPVPLELWPVSRALRGEAATAAEYRLRRIDSGEDWVGSYSYSPVHGDDGKISGAAVVCHDITAIEAARAELAASHMALQRLIAAHESVADEERRRIARELYDDLQQALAALDLYLDAAARAVTEDPSVARATLARSREILAGATASTHRIIADLRPEVLEQLGLGEALADLALRFTERTGVTCAVERSPRCEEHLTPELESAFYRVAQEALNNAAKHARASHVELSMATSDDGGCVLRIADDGVGFGDAARSKRHSFGLIGMRERMSALGGTLTTHSGPGAGTVVEAAARPPGDGCRP